MPTLYGLGDILDREKVVTSLQSIYRYNFKERLGDIYNPCRVFGMDDESGTVIATWPDESSQAGGAGSLRAGDHARHGVRLRPDADGLWHARGRREGHGRRPRPLRRREAQSLERDRVRLELCALDGELGRHDRALGLQLRRHAAAISALRRGCRTAASSAASGPAPMPTAPWSSPTATSGSTCSAATSFSRASASRRTAARPTAARFNCEPDRGRSGDRGGPVHRPQAWRRGPRGRQRAGPRFAGTARTCYAVACPGRAPRD